MIAIDRRGRGDSTDGDEYSLERECDDVAAVVRDAGDGALLFGHSYGGLVAAGAALRLDLPRLALYEPAMGGGLTTAETIEPLGAADRGRRARHRHARVPAGDRAATTMPPSTELERTPLWERAGGSSRRVPRELRAELAHRFDDVALGELDMPVLLLVGSESPAWAVRSVEAHAEAIPRRRDAQSSRATGTART